MTTAGLRRKYNNRSLFGEITIPSWRLSQLLSALTELLISALAVSVQLAAHRGALARLGACVQICSHREPARGQLSSLRIGKIADTAG